MEEQRTTAAGTPDRGVGAEGDASAQHDSARPRAAGRVPAGERSTSLPGNAVRGALIGVVETVPGVSGGTVALVVGIYHQLIDSASHVVSAVRRLITGPRRTAGFRENLAAVHWRVVLPVLIGMIVAVFSLAGPMADLIEAQPELTRAAFFGMVLASIAVPLRMVREDLRQQSRNSEGCESVGKKGSGPEIPTGTGAANGLRPGHVIAGLLAAAVTFLLVSLPPTSVEVHPLIIVPAAMVAVSALVLPGLSGSFLLLTVGLYEPTLRAVEARDFGYLSLFLIGMVLGMVVIVKILKWLLEHRHTITLIVLSAVMLGALRSLWPWQSEVRDLLAPGQDWGAAVGLGVAGFLVVAALVFMDSRLAARSSQGHPSD